MFPEVLPGVGVTAVSKEIFTFPPGLEGPVVTTTSVCHPDWCVVTGRDPGWAGTEQRENWEMSGHSSVLTTVWVKTHTGTASLPSLTRLIIGLSLSLSVRFIIITVARFQQQTNNTLETGGCSMADIRNINTTTSNCHRNLLVLHSIVHCPWTTSS